MGIGFYLAMTASVLGIFVAGFFLGWLSSGSLYRRHGLDGALMTLRKLEAWLSVGDKRSMEIVKLGDDYVEGPLFDIVAWDGGVSGTFDTPEFECGCGIGANVLDALRKFEFNGMDEIVKREHVERKKVSHEQLPLDLRGL